MQQEKDQPDHFDDIFFDIDTSELKSINTLVSNYFIEKLKGHNLLIYIPGEKQYAENFYDTKNLMLLNNNVELIQINHHNFPKYRSDRRFFLLNDTKNNISTQYDIKSYKKQSKPYDKHPVIGQIKRKSRNDILSHLNHDQASINSLSKKFTIEHQSSGFSVYRLGDLLMEVDIDYARTKNFGANAHKAQLSIRQRSKNIATLPKNEQEVYRLFLNELVSLILDQPYSQRKSLGTNYQNYSEILNKKTPLRSFYLDNPLLFKTLQAILLMAIFSLPLYLLINRQNTKKINLRTKMK